MTEAHESEKMHPTLMGSESLGRTKTVFDVHSILPEQCRCIRLVIMARLVSPGRTVVLVAEDESLVRMFTADFLVEAGYTVIEASSAVAALRQLEVTPNVRVLLTDVEMPGEMDGLELAREVQSRWPEVVIIVTSDGRAQPRGTGCRRRVLPKPLCEEAVQRSANASRRRTRKSDHTRPDALP